MIAPGSQVWCIVVAKDFSRAKSRLATVLSPEARAALSRRMLGDVLSVCRSDPQLQTLVATDAGEVAAFSQAAGAHVLRDVGDETLGRVIDRALAHTRGLGATHAIVWMSDLPRLAFDDLATVTHAWSTADVLIGPDRQRQGTNMLAVALDRPFASCFGRADSFAAHQAAAKAQALSVCVIDRPGIAFDLDTPDDYVLWKS